MTAGAETRSALEQATFALRRGYLPRASKLLQGIVHKEPANADALHLLANARGRLGDFAAAERSINQALALRSDHAAYHNTLGNICRQLRRRSAALAAYLTATQLDPDFVGAHFNLGLLLSELGNHERAMQSLERAIELRPDYADAHFQLGALAWAAGDTRSARKAFEQTLQVAPRHAQAHSLLAAVHVFRGEYERARRYASAALAETPDLPGAQLQFNLATCQYGAYPDRLAAAQALSDACSGAPERFDILEAAADGLVATDQAVRGRDLLQRWVSPQAPETTRGELALALALEGRERAAHAVLPANGESVPVRMARALLIADDKAALTLLQPLSRRSADQPVSSAQRRRGNFMLGDFNDLVGDYEQAFVHYQLANLARGKRFNGARFYRELSRRRAFFVAQRIATMRRPSLPAQRLVIVAGGPGSGATRLRRLLLAHPSFAGGYLSPQDPLEQCYASGSEPEALLAPASLSSLRASVVVSSRPEARYCVVNADPLAFGMLDLLYPQSVVVRCQRDRADQALAAFASDWREPRHAFTSDLAHIGTYLLLQDDLFAHWQSNTQLEWISCDFDELQTTSGAAAQRLFAALGERAPGDAGIFGAFGRAGGLASLTRRRARLDRYGRSDDYGLFMRAFSEARRSDWRGGGR